MTEAPEDEHIVPMADELGDPPAGCVLDYIVNLKALRWPLKCE
jgi:hypothetical protein